MSQLPLAGGGPNPQGKSQHVSEVGPIAPPRQEVTCDSSEGNVTRGPLLHPQERVGGGGGGAGGGGGGVFKGI